MIRNGVDTQMDYPQNLSESDLHWYDPSNNAELAENQTANGWLKITLPYQPFIIMKTASQSKRSITSTLTNARPLTWPAVQASPACEFYPAASVTMEADLPEMTGRFGPDIWEAQ